MSEMRVLQTVDLLIVDDDDEYRSTVVRRLARRGYKIQEAADGASALAAAQRREFDVGLFDMCMPEMSGVDLMERFKAVQPDCEVILLTGQGTAEAAARSRKLGAFDYLLKPYPLSDLEVVIERAVTRGRLAKENAQLKQVLARSQVAADIIGNSAAMREVYHFIKRVGPTDKAILIHGESGTGKELIARALHALSTRADKPFGVINCAAIAETLLEIELFGHEAGPFSEVVASKSGLFELVHGGTLFIDEIGAMPEALQPKLLSVLEDGTVRRIDSAKARRVDVRLVAATNRNMAAEVEARRFREVLYYRINGVSLRLPPLREREGDLPLLVRTFLGDDWQIEPDALDAIERYTWPGNIRQLINAIDRAKMLADGHVVRYQDLPREITQSTSSSR